MICGKSRDGNRGLLTVNYLPMTAKQHKEFLEKRINKQITLIDRMGDEYHVTVIAVRDTLFVVKFPWGSLLDISYEDNEYDFKP
jgi:hypothetical protein